MKKAIILIALLFIPKVAFTQTHYCDTVPPTSGTATVGVLPIELCQAAVDIPTSFKLYIDGAGGATLTLTTDNIISLGGQKVWHGTVQVLLGTHTYQVSAVNAVGESAKSPSFTLTANPVPTAPTSPAKVKVG